MQYTPLTKPKPEVKSERTPSWDALYEVAANQQGCFTREQALAAGFSDQLLYKHLSTGNIERIQRGIYRITRFPESSREQEDLVVIWLWSLSKGVFSHETALRLHGLSDALPSKIHLTLPAEWRQRHLSPPAGVRLYFSNFTAADYTFIGVVPVTKPARTINDVAATNGDAAIVEAAVRQALHRGFAAPAELFPAVEYLAMLRMGVGRVQPEAVSDLQGSWLMEVVSGICKLAPPVDWRVDAEELAAAVQGRLCGAQYFSGSKTMTIKIVWPVSARDTMPKDLRAKAIERFGWIS
jgi:predicted transcriptional regulator of viral defense system